MVEVTPFSTNEKDHEPLLTRLREKNSQRRQLPFSANIKSLLGGETEQKGLD